MKGGKPQVPKQPVNINISFNINPKHITQTQNNANMKIAHHIFHHSSRSPQKNRFKQEKEYFNESSIPKPTNKHGSKFGSRYSEQPQLCKKQLDSLKKKFLAKINNIDIQIPALCSQSNQFQEQEEDDRQSLMSAKLQQFGTANLDSIAMPKGPDLHLDLHRFKEEKSKILCNEGISKVLGVTTIKNNKLNNKKQCFSQTKQLYKWVSQQQPYLTERKTKEVKDRSKKELKKKKSVLREQSLKEKLQRFKVDMMKLALFYEENEVIKTKMSSQFYNMRSRQISKDYVQLGSEEEEHQKIQEIRQFEKKPEFTVGAFKKKQQAGCEAKASQQFVNFKQIYRSLKESSLDEDDKVGNTHEIIVNYKKLLDDNQFQADPKEVNGQGSELAQSFKESSSKSVEQQNLEQVRKGEDNAVSRGQSSENLLSEFISFVQSHQSFQDGDKLKSVVDSLLQEFISKKNGVVKTQQKQQNNKSDESDHLAQLDIKINEELLSIPTLSKQLIDNNPIHPQLMAQLINWQKSYTEKFLNMKGKMWRQYRNIRNEVQSRINSGVISSPISTHKLKKRDKIMKCLSQKYLRHSYFPPISIRQMSPLSNLKEKQFVGKQFLIQDSSSEDDFLSPPVFIVKSDERKMKLDEEQQQKQVFFDSRVIFNEVDLQKSEDIMVNGSMLTRIQKQIKQYEKQICQDDKEDVFQFIFLDLCIELYQDYVEKEGYNMRKGIMSGAERIMNSIKKYIAEEKKRKVFRESKKIGISTSIGTIREVLKKIIDFLISSSSKTEMTETLLKKLNSPLGPSEKEMLRSLRIPILQNAEREDDFQQDYQQGDLLILQSDWFLLFENEVINVQKLQFPKFYESEERDQQRINFLRNCTHIHHKAIFDCLNEHLDYQRVFGIWGRPFTWKKKASFFHTFLKENIGIALNQAGSQVLRAATFACGLMPTKEESMIKDIAGDENYVRRLQDERIYKYLEDFVMDMQQKWFFHDDQETETLMQISHIVWTFLLKQALRDLTILQNR